MGGTVPGIHKLLQKVTIGPFGYCLKKDGLSPNILTGELKVFQETPPLRHSSA